MTLFFHAHAPCQWLIYSMAKFNVSEIKDVQPDFSRSKSTIETPEQWEICSKLTIKTPERRQ